MRPGAIAGPPTETAQTIADGESAGDPAIATDRAWASLPATFAAGRIELIVRDASRWRLKWRFSLGPR